LCPQITFTISIFIITLYFEFMVTKTLATGLAGAIGSRYLKTKNQLLFVEWGGFISKIDLVRPLLGIVSQGTATIKGTWLFDCEAGTITAPGATLDIWWEQQTAIQRKMVPQGGAKIVNLGVVDFNAVTPAALQSYDYTTTPIIGNNDASNKLVVGDVFCVKTIEGNYSKLQVVTYGYDLVVKWVTYKLAPAYARIGSGYTQLQDIAVTADETFAYVTERGGNILKVNLTSANRASATVVASGLIAPHQLYYDQPRNRAYVVEYANPGRLMRVDLNTGAKTTIATGLNFPVGLILTSDLAFAYVSEQGLSAITRIELSTGIKTTIATGLTQPFMLSWSDASETKLLVPERDPANRISLVDVTRPAPNVTVFIAPTSARPSSIAMVTAGTYCVCSDAVVDAYFLTTVLTGSLYKGVGYVPFNLITAAGFADTTTQPTYFAQFPKNSPFGGTMPIMIDHRRAWDAGAAYYRVLMNPTMAFPGAPRLDIWDDLVMNPANGRFEIIERQSPDANGYYRVHNPGMVYYNNDLGCLLNSTNLSNGLHQMRIEFYNAARLRIDTLTGSSALLINNHQCIASLDLPTLDGNPADPNCGYLKYVNTASIVRIHWVASHPQGFATYAFLIIKGANSYFGETGAIAPDTSKVGNFAKSVADMLGTCPGVAAFADSLGVYSTVINGIGRQSQYDAYAHMAFCLAK
jgi:hypothetical protein